MQLPEQIIESVQRDVQIYEQYLRKIAVEVIERGISQFPIFVAHREPHLTIGKPIVETEQMNCEWNINASLLEEFTAKKLIQSHLIVSFKQIYKDPTHFACLFIVSGNNDAGFAFYPYSVSTAFAAIDQN